MGCGCSENRTWPGRHHFTRLHRPPPPGRHHFTCDLGDFTTVLFHVIETGPSSLSIQFLYMHRPCSNLSIYLSFYNGEETGGFATCAGQGSPSGAVSWRFRCRRRSCNVLCVCVQPFSSLFLTSQKIQAKNHEKVLFSCFISWRHYMTPFFARLPNLTFLHFQ